MTVGNHGFVAILVGAAVYALFTFWAYAEASGRRRWGWVAAIWLLGPIGPIAWLARGRRLTDPRTA